MDDSTRIFDDRRLYTQAEAAPVLGKSHAWFERARWAGTGPQYIKIGRSVRYSGAALNDYLAAGLRRSTSERP